MQLKHAECIYSFVMLAISFILYKDMEAVPFEGKVFPVAIIALLVFCSCLLALRALIALLRKTNTAQKCSFFGDVAPGKWLFIVGVFSAYVLFSMSVSFLCGTFLLAIILPALLTDTLKKDIVVIVLYALGLVGFFDIFFIRIMNFRFASFF